MIRSLFGKIFLSHVFVLVVFALSMGLLLSHFLTGYLIDAKREDLIRAGLIEARYLMELDQKQEAISPDLLEAQSRLSGTRMWVLARDGHVVAGSPPVPWQKYHLANKDRNADTESLFQGEITSHIHAKTEEDPSLVVSIPYSNTKEKVLMLYTPINGVAKTSTAMEHLLLWVLAGSVFVAVFAAFWLSRSLTGPIHAISLAAKRFAAREYGTRTKITGSDEIGQLGRVFNDMAAVIEKKEKNTQAFFADITHELKTPLAAIQAITESFLDGIVKEEKDRERFMGVILRECSQMNRLISEILLLEQLEAAKVRFHWSDVEVVSFLTLQREKYLPLLEEKMLQIELETEQPAYILRTDEQRLEQILNNLLSNAIRYSFPGGRIFVRIVEVDGKLCLSVTDHGEGIPADSLPYVWDRFYRTDKSRSRHKGGTGLGLAVTKKLAESMGGKVFAESRPGQETIFTVQLPI